MVKLTSGDTVRARVDARRGAVGDKVELGIRPEHLVPLGHAHADSPRERRGAGSRTPGAESFVCMDVDGHDFTVKASSDIDVATGQSTASASRPKPATCSMPKSRRSRARPNISAPERREGQVFLSIRSMPFAGRKTGFLIPVIQKPGSGQRGRLAGNPSPPVLV